MCEAGNHKPTPKLGDASYIYEYNICADLVLEIIDTDTLNDAGSSHFWLYKHPPDRADNLL